MIQSIINGLLSVPKYISSRFLYDDKGSELFRKITGLPEYYLTRTEKGLIKDTALSLKNRLLGSRIVELGSGDCSKISLLLDTILVREMSTINYEPVDINRGVLMESALTLVRRYPGLTVHCIVADFSSQLHLIPRAGKRLFCFFGSTIGNLSKPNLEKFWRYLGEIMFPEDLLLLGIDMVKSRDILERAYNDSSNVTAVFNKNILNVINSIAGTNFNPRFFAHEAFFNEGDSRIEMHLRALKEMDISCPHINTPIRVSEGEMIHTENSCKFTINGIEEGIKPAGLKIDSVISDSSEFYSLVQIKKEI